MQSMFTFEPLVQSGPLLRATRDIAGRSAMIACLIACKIEILLSA